MSFTDKIATARTSATALAIYRIPENILTFVAVSAGAIETFAGVARDDIDDAATIAAALDAIAQSKPVADPKPLDARYALIFTNASGERVLRAYKGLFASNGQIDDESCAYDEPALDGWLHARYAGAPA